MEGDKRACQGVVEKISCGSVENWIYREILWHRLYTDGPNCTGSAEIWADQSVIFDLTDLTLGLKFCLSTSCFLPWLKYLLSDRVSSFRWICLTTKKRMSRARECHFLGRLTRRRTRLWLENLLYLRALPNYTRKNDINWINVML